ncbi:hypothetical protein FZEAL_9770 [Fusarium zealandicum]|uniref:Uncharacterized protein n=1 Tax=Fusarium zealandicum TaxID=1053134 RepID=A0A8H4U877_9HYPO|nr:hypothetical protein FZEAL_9770 [Fusarium zealandicum]
MGNFSNRLLPIKKSKPSPNRALAVHGAQLFPDTDPKFLGADDVYNSLMVDAEYPMCGDDMDEKDAAPAVAPRLWPILALLVLVVDQRISEYPSSINKEISIPCSQ